MSKLKLVVGVPVYNDQRFIGELLSDLCAQEYEHLQIIISDNCSTDRTGEICQRYAKEDARITYVRQSTNIGAQENFRTVLALGEGDFFFWAASDDRFHPRFASTLVDALIRQPGAVSAFCRYEEINTEGVPIGEAIRLDYGSSSAIKRVAKFWLDNRRRRDVWIYGVHRMRAIKSLPDFQRASFPRAQGHDSSYVQLTYMLALGDYAYVEETLYRRRVHPPATARHQFATMGGASRLQLPLFTVAAKGYVIKESSVAAYRACKSMPVGLVALVCSALQNGLFLLRFGLFVPLNQSVKALSWVKDKVAPWER